MKKVTSIDSNLICRLNTIPFMSLILFMDPFLMEHMLLTSIPPPVKPEIIMLPLKNKTVLCPNF